MKSRIHLILVVSSTVLTPANPAGAGIALTAVSPETPSRVVASGCPTFRWGEVERANEVELVVYRLDAEEPADPPVLHRRFPGTTRAYTPAPEECPWQRSRYAWAVRALTPEGSGEWSGPRLLEVASAPAFHVAWHTIDGGGGIASGGEFAAVVTIGQPEPHLILVGGAYALKGGFWPRYSDFMPIFADGFESGTVDAWSSSTSSPAG